MVKIPSALKWMLSRRARLKGERDRLVARLPELVSTIGKETAQAERRLSSCKRRLAIAELHGPGRLEATSATFLTLRLVMPFRRQQPTTTAKTARPCPLVLSESPAGGGQPDGFPA